MRLGADSFACALVRLHRKESTESSATCQNLRMRFRYGLHFFRISAPP
jgi:hypothetical protein